MIWDLIEQSQFDKHFSNDQLTVTELLLDQNIITELKNQNPKLLDYINHHKQKFISELIEYTITMPKQSDGHDRCHKLPYISSELLAIDSELIYQQFFPKDASQSSNPFWIQLLQFLQSVAAQNEILMGYFQKVINNLYNGNKIKTTRIIAYYLEKFIRLIHNGSIGDILKKCIILLNTPQGQVLLEREKILARVIDKFTSGNQQEKEICSQVLVDVVNKFQAFSSGDVLIQKLLASNDIHSIYTQHHKNAINHFLINLLKKSQQRIINEKDESVRLLTIPQKHYQNLQKHLRNQIEGIDSLLTNNEYITNQNKVLVRKSNKKIYSILALASLSIQEALYDFITSSFISNLWKLIILYPYNNILQVHILKIFINVLRAPNKEVNNIFLDHYEAYTLELFQSHFQMFRPFVYTIWKQAKLHQSQTKDQQLLKKFVVFAQKQLEPLVKYQINKNTLKSNQTPHKLIVDQQDKPSESIQNHPTNVQDQKQPTSTVTTESFQPTANQSVQAELKKANFDFFSGWQNEKKQSKSIQEAPKTNVFDDFTNFF